MAVHIGNNAILQTRVLIGNIVFKYWSFGRRQVTTKLHHGQLSLLDYVIIAGSKLSWQTRDIQYSIPIDAKDPHFVELREFRQEGECQCDRVDEEVSVVIFCVKACKNVPGGKRVVIRSNQEHVHHSNLKL